MSRRGRIITDATEIYIHRARVMHQTSAATRNAANLKQVITRQAYVNYLSKEEHISPKIFSQRHAPEIFKAIAELQPHQHQDHKSVLVLRAKSIIAFNFMEHTSFDLQSQTKPPRGRTPRQIATLTTVSKTDHSQGRNHLTKSPDWQTWAKTRT